MKGKQNQIKAARNLLIDKVKAEYGLQRKTRLDNIVNSAGEKK